MLDLHKYIEEQLAKANLKADKPVVVAVSGGVDSICLLHIMIDIAVANGISLERIIVAHFNHQLRTSSDQEAEYIQALAKEKGLSYVISRWHQATKHSENAAREARYQFFADVLTMTQAEVLMTAHHKDDNAETMMMRIIRGTSLKGMQGITSHSERFLKNKKGEVVRAILLRPLLDIQKQELYAYAAQNELTYFEDMTNVEGTYFRNRVRHQIIPMMAQENPRITDSLHQLSKNLTMSYQAHLENYQQYEPEIVSMLSPNEWIISIAKYQQLSKNMKWIFLMLFFEERLVDIIPNYRKDVIEQFAYLMEQSHAPHATLDLGNNCSAKREYQHVYIIQNKKDQKRIAKNAQAEIAIHELNKWYPLSAHERVGIFHAHQVTSNLLLDAKSSIGLSLEPISMLPLKIRHRQPGDRIKLGGIDGPAFHKKIARIMIDEKIPQRKRQQCWLVINREEEILALLPNVIATHEMIDFSNHPNYLFLYQEM